MTPEERYWSKVTVKDLDECWPWTGYSDGSYGTFWLPVWGTVFAHRYCFYLKSGHWPEPNANHTCDFGLCQNPKHIYEGTQLDNISDQVFRGRHADNNWSTHKGEENGMHKLSDADVDYIRTSGVKSSILAKRLGVRLETISRIKTRRSRV